MTTCALTAPPGGRPALESASRGMRSATTPLDSSLVIRSMRCRFLVGKGGRSIEPRVVSPRQFGALSTALNSVGEGFLGFAGAADSSLRRVHIIPFAAAYDRSGMQPALAINGLNRGSGVPVSHGDAEAALSSRNHTSSPTDVSVVQTLSCLTSGSPSATHGWLDQLLCDVRNPRVLEIRGRNW